MYEIHITVSPTGHDIFSKACSELGVKPLFIELQGLNHVDFITSSTLSDKATEIGDIRAKAESCHIAAGLKERGFKVIREKVESSLDHPRVQLLQDCGPCPSEDYLECHFNVIGDPKGVMSFMRDNRHALLFSKRNDVQIMTYRTYDSSKSSFLSEVRRFRDLMTLRGLEVEVHSEYCLSDSNLGHDTAWIEYNNSMFK